MVLPVSVITGVQRKPNVKAVYSSGISREELTLPVPPSVPVVAVLPRITHLLPSQPATKRRDKSVTSAARPLAASKCKVIIVESLPLTSQYSVVDTPLIPVSSVLVVKGAPVGRLALEGLPAK